MTAIQVEIVPCLIPVFQGQADVRGARGGRGSGKTQSFAKMVAVKGYIYGKSGIAGQLVCGRQFMNSLADSSLEECKRAIESEPFLRDYYDIGENYIKSRDGVVWFTFCGLDRNVESVKSKGRILVMWIDEARNISQRALDIVQPTLREEGGNWNAELWVTWNPELDTDPIEQFTTADDPLVKIADCSYRDNPRFPDRLERQRLRDKASKPRHEYEWIWEGKFLPAVIGAIYSNEIDRATQEGRITRVAHDKMLRIHPIFDLGWNDSMSIIIAQRSASELRVIDYIEDSHKKLSDYSLMLRGDVEGLVQTGMPREEAEKHAHRRAYSNWGNAWLPHDGFSKDYKTGKSAEEMMKAMGWEVSRTPSMDIEGGIKAAREVFERVWFDKEKAARLVECLKRYRRNVGQKTGEAGSPLHDEFSHGADAFRYLCIDADQMTNAKAKKRTISIDEPNGSWMGS